MNETLARAVRSRGPMITRCSGAETRRALLADCEMADKPEPHDRRLDAGDSVRRYLGAHRLFGVLPGPILDEIAQQALERKCAAGHHVYQVGDAPSYVFAIRSGFIVLTDEDEHGNLHPVQTYSAGDVCGLATVILSVPRRFSALALTDVELLLIPRATVTTLLQRFPDLTQQVMKELAQMLCRSQQTSFNLTLTPVTRRVARFLSESASGTRSASNAGGAPVVTFSRHDLALVAGTSRETVTRVLTRLSRLGLISVQGRQIKIIKIDQLREAGE